MIPQCFFDTQYPAFLSNYIHFPLSSLLFLEIKRSLAAPALSNTENELQPRGLPEAPALSRALARVLSTTESKENEAEAQYPNTALGEYAKDNRSAGTT